MRHTPTKSEPLATSSLMRDIAGIEIAENP